MASENVTVLATLPGLMEQIQVMGGELVVKSKLMQAVWSTPALNAKTAQFPYYPEVSPASAQTEANAVTPGAITIGQRLAEIAMFPSATRASWVAVMGGQRIPEHLANVMINDVSAGVDKHIMSIATRTNFSSHTPIASCVTGSAFREGVKSLRQGGYSGQIKAALTEYQLQAITESERDFFNPAWNDRVVSEGYQGTTRVGGVEVYSLPSDWCPTDSTSGFKTGLMWMNPRGLGLAYHPGPGDQGLLHFDMAKPDVFDDVLGVAAFVKATHLSTYGGVLLLSDSATE